MVPNKREILIIATIIATIGVFYSLTIREGHNWGGDFSMYIHHAKNIAEGIDYEDTGYIYNPYYPSFCPRTCPPIFPLLLSPIYKWFGLNLRAMKIEIILIFLASLFMVFLVFKNQLPFRYLVATVAIIGFNPYFWWFKDSILSDIPFLFFVYLSLFFIHQAYRFNKSQRSQVLHAFLVGLFIYLSSGTRSIGIVLVPCLLIYDVIRSRRLTRFAIIATLVFVFLYVIQTILLHSDRYYLDQFVAVDYKVIFRNLFYYAGLLSTLWNSGYSKILWGAFLVIVYALAVTGFVARIRERTTIFEIFLLLYVVVLIIWPSVQGIRFLIPVIPLCIFYVFGGVKRMIFFQQRKMERSVFILLTAAIFVSYVAQYTKTDYGPIREGINKKETIELFAYIRENTGEEDIFVFRKPRVLSLFTGRSASIYHHPRDDKDLWDYFQEINATYLVRMKKSTLVVKPTSLRNLISKYKDSLEEVYFNSDFEVYRIKHILDPGVHPSSWTD